jgi:hypothetical protein
VSPYFTITLTLIFLGWSESNEQLRYEQDTFKVFGFIDDNVTKYIHICK